MEYYRRHANIQGHPKVVAAGFWGHAVFTTLCDISAEFDLGGELPAHYCSADFLVRRANIWDADCPPGGALQAVCNGMQRARVAGLVAQHEDGSLSILGWLERNPSMPLTSTQRSQKRREIMRMDRMQRNATQGTLPGVAATQERRGEERREKQDASVLILGERVADQPTNDVPPDGALVVFEHWKATMRKNARATFDDKRRRAVVRAMERHGYTVVELIAAVDGCKASAFHQGLNADRRIYDDLELICRDPKHIDQFINIARTGGGPNVAMGRVGAESQEEQHELTPEERARLGVVRG